MDLIAVDPGAEAQRLAAIHRYEILDTPPEASFDRVVDIVASVFKAQIALVTLVDRERSWFKAIRGLPISQLNRPEAMCDTVIQQDGVYVIADALRAPAGEVGPLLKFGLRFYVAAPLRTHDGIKLGTVCAFDARPRRVTEREKKVLADLADIVIDELELRIAARRMTLADDVLRRVNQQLEAASRNKNEFLANMSHELRSPLNSILGASELLADGLFGRLNTKQQEYMTDIHASGNHLLSLIEDVLDLSKIEAGTIELRRNPLDVAAFMESCTTVVRGYAAAKSMHLVTVPPPEPVLFEADERRIKQVACNMLSNALKFSPEQGHVAFSAWRNGSEVVFLVEDDGPGIPPQFHEQLFEQFFRIQSDQEGTGLGLALAKRLVELHRGRVWLESTVGRGSRFFFSVPLSA